jgi:hypothetical protein
MGALMVQGTCSSAGKDAGFLQLQGLFGERPPRTPEQVFEGLADVVEEHLDLPFLLERAGIA